MRREQWYTLPFKKKLKIRSPITGMVAGEDSPNAEMAAAEGGIQYVTSLAHTYVSQEA